MELVPSVHPALPSQPRYSIRPAQPQPRRIYAWANGLLPFGGLAVQGVLRRSARAAYADAGATDPKGQLLLLCAAGNRGFSAKEAEKDEARNDANLGGVVGLWWSFVFYDVVVRRNTVLKKIYSLSVIVSVLRLYQGRRVWLGMILPSLPQESTWSLHRCQRWSQESVLPLFLFSFRT